MRNRSGVGIGRVVLAALAVSLAVPASATVLVVRSNGPSSAGYPAGRTLPDDAVLRLLRTDSVTVLTARGTRVFRGPGTFRLAAAPAIADSGERRQARQRIGAVRGPGGEILPPDPWYVDASRSGSACIREQSRPLLWRRDDSAQGRLRIETGGSTASFDWPAGQTWLDWPLAAPPEADRDYLLSLDGSDRTARLRFSYVRADDSDPIAVAAAFIDRGCQAQLNALIMVLNES